MTESVLSIIMEHLNGHLFGLCLEIMRNYLEIRSLKSKAKQQ